MDGWMDDLLPIGCMFDAGINVTFNKNSNICRAESV